jgi:8-oxo-dGTP pyrophosphatase MutT (NUDIX family)
VEGRRGEPPRREGRGRRSGRWGPDGRLELPKGKLEPGETPEQAAVREVREELGLRGTTITVRGELSRNNYVFRTPEGKSIFKTVHYFLLECPDEHQPRFEPRREEGIVSVEWWPARRAIAQVAFRNLRPVLERAWERVQG